MMQRYAMSMKISHGKSLANPGVISTSDKKSKGNNITVDLGDGESLHFAICSSRYDKQDTLYFTV